MKMYVFFSSWFVGLVAILTPSLASADAASCATVANDVTCTAAEVGTPCPSGGKCVEFSCPDAAGSSSTVVYKCKACPTVVADANQTCNMAQDIGKSCGTQATCRLSPPDCNLGYVACLEGAVPTGAGGGSASPTTGGAPSSAGGSASGGSSAGTAGTAGAATNAPTTDSGGCSVPSSLAGQPPIWLFLTVGFSAFRIARRRQNKK